MGQLCSKAVKSDSSDPKKSSQSEVKGSDSPNQTKTSAFSTNSTALVSTGDTEFVLGSSCDIVLTSTSSVMIPADVAADGAIILGTSLSIKEVEGYSLTDTESPEKLKTVKSYGSRSRSSSTQENSGSSKENSSVATMRQSVKRNSILIYLHVSLVPHQHTLFCERKERVCTAVGKVQELESLVATGLDSKSSSQYTSYWLRSKPEYIHNDGSIERTDFSKMFTPIPESNNQLTYKLTAQDVGCYITFSVTMNGQVYYSPDMLGPVLAGPPRMLDLQIAGEMSISKHVSASGQYIGGVEGPSEYWWMRIKDGVRENISEPTPISQGEQTNANDPRNYEITDKDVGCVLKVKCRPIRNDGIRGEIFTSKASDIIT